MSGVLSPSKRVLNNMRQSAGAVQDPRSCLGGIGWPEHLIPFRRNLLWGEPQSLTPLGDPWVIHHQVKDTHTHPHQAGVSVRKDSTPTPTRLWRPTARLAPLAPVDRASSSARSATRRCQRLGARDLPPSADGAMLAGPTKEGDRSGVRAAAELSKRRSERGDPFWMGRF